MEAHPIGRKYNAVLLCVEHDVLLQALTESSLPNASLSAAADSSRSTKPSLAGMMKRGEWNICSCASTLSSEGTQPPAHGDGMTLSQLQSSILHCDVWKKARLEPDTHVTDGAAPPCMLLTATTMEEATRLVEQVHSKQARSEDPLWVVFSPLGKRCQHGGPAPLDGLLRSVRPQQSAPFGSAAESCFVVMFHEKLCRCRGPLHPPMSLCEHSADATQVRLSGIVAEVCYKLGFLPKYGA